MSYCTVVVTLRVEDVARLFNVRCHQFLFSFFFVHCIFVHCSFSSSSFSPTSRRRGAAAPHLDDDNHAELLFILGLFVEYSDCNLFFLIDVDIDVDGGGEIDGTCPSNTD